MFTKLHKKLDIIHLPLWLTLFLLFLFVARIPSFIEPFYYGDEMIYLTLGRGIREGLTLYRDIHDNKPPLLYFLASIAGNVFWFRAILAFWFLFTTAIFWKLTERLFSKRSIIAVFATILFGIFGTLPLLEGQIANAENFMILFIIASVFIIVRGVNKKGMLAVGFLMSLAALFKVPAATEVLLMLVLVVLYKEKKESWGSIFSKYFIFAIGFATPILLTMVWYFVKGAGREYLIAAFLQNIGYLSSFRPDAVKEPFLVKNAPVLIRGIIMLTGIGIVLAAKNKLTKPFMLVTIWLLTSLFSVTLSERPYPHYFLQSLPALSILFSILVLESRKIQVYTVVPLALTFFIAYYYHFWHYDSVSYYARFFSFASGQTSVTEYRKNFSGNVNRTYEIATYLMSSTKEGERVFVWGDSSPIYALSRRLPPIKFTATYHIHDFSSPREVVDQLKENPPAFIILLPEDRAPDELMNFLIENYYLADTIDGASIYRRASENVVKFLSY